MNSLELDPKDEAVSAAVAGCEVGEEKTITVTGTVTEVGGVFKMDVTSAEYSEPENAEEDATEGVEEKAAPTEKMPMSKGKMVGKGGNPGLVILMGGKHSPE